MLIRLRYVLDRPDSIDVLLLQADKIQEKWQALNQRLMRCCQRVWEAVQGVLCIDSPEGQHDSLEVDDKEPVDIGVKDILSYCWRSLKESR